MNNMVWDIFETIVNLFESYIIVRFISRVQGYKYIGIIKYITFALAVLISFFELNLMNNMVSFEGVAIFIPIVTMYIYAYFCLKGDNFRKIFISILVMVLIIIINSFVAFLVSFLTGTNLNGLISQKNIYRLITIILTKMIFFIVTTLAIKFLKTETNSLLGNKEWFVVLFSPIVSIFLCVQIININISLALEREKLIQVVLLFICIVLVNISNYYLFLKISKIGRTKEELDFLKQRYDCQIKGLDDIKITYCEIRKLRHDLQNNMFCILALLEQGNYIKAAEYANNLSERIEKTKVFVGTDSEAINCMINLKLKTAEEKEINFKYDIVEHLGKINEVDTCILIANLLDNAIEACQNINKERRIIELIICRRGQELLITIKNCINKSVLENNPDLTTKKKDNKFHGLGRLSAKSIVERYSGNLIYYERSGFFCCEAKLYFPNEIREPHLVTCEEKVKF
ncbi:MAG: hypothetical protein RUMPE_01304 [Eubacteriales bacterium SKADARSKE-1]|nr:hypothetical protein [Eubacteriales bacterium SKADARSKE-1]